MTKAEIAILDSRSPDEYIEASLKSRLNPAAKARLAKEWMAKTGYTREDILYARNRHPYWRKKKMEGSVERTRRRLEAHNYSKGTNIPWSRERVEEFLSLNGKDREGRYERKDWQLAEHFGSSIPSVQYMRRKCRKVEDMLGPRASKGRVIEYLLCAESVLSRGSEAVEASFAAAKEKARSLAGSKPGAKAAKPKTSRPEKAVARPAARPAARKEAAKQPAKTRAKLPVKTAGKLPSRQAALPPRKGASSSKAAKAR
jgi:hypothetical protein